MPAMSASRAASFESRSGAKPPSSPTAVERPRSCSVRLSAWKTSAPVRTASEKVGAPAGSTMNSWKSTLLSAWAPPLSTFIIGTGSTRAASPPRYRHSGWRSSAAAARAAASETPRIAFAPRRDLSGVPSSSISARSSPAWSSTSAPCTASAISPLTFATAFVTPLPSQASPPSRSSVASNSPVDAPDGTAARPCAPERSTSSTSTFGFPRESRIWRAWTVSIWLKLSALLCHARPRVERELVVGPEIVPVAAVRCRQPLGVLDPRAEAVGGGAQRELGVDLELAREVDGREQHVPDLVEARLAVVRRLELVELAAHRLVGHVVEVEAGRRRAALQLARVQR